MRFKDLIGYKTAVQFFKYSLLDIFPNYNSVRDMSGFNQVIQGNQNGTLKTRRRSQNVNGCAATHQSFPSFTDISGTKSIGNRENKNSSSFEQTSYEAEVNKHRVVTVAAKEKNEEQLSFKDEIFEKLRAEREDKPKELYLFLKQILFDLAELGTHFLFSIPVDPNKCPDDYRGIQTPYDFETLICKVYLQEYRTIRQFLLDIDLVIHNAFKYSPENFISDGLTETEEKCLKSAARFLVSKAIVDELSENYWSVKIT